MSQSALVPTLVPRSNAPAPGARAAASPHRRRIGAARDVFEQQADQAAEHVTAGRLAGPVWSLARMTIAPRVQRSPERDPGRDLDREFAPPLVEQVLRTPGVPLDAEARRSFEPAFQHDFSRVRIHQDGQSAESALAVGAHAYTAGNDVVFAAGRYRPDSAQGRRLLAHELAHVVQQAAAPSPVLQREVSPDQPASATTSTWDRAFALADEARWEEVAELVNGFSAEHLGYFLQTYKAEPAKLAQLYLGATGNKRVGPQSQVAHATRVIYLDFNLNQETRKGDWSRAAYYLNGFNADDVRARCKRMKTDNLKALHTGAVDNSELGVDSNAARISAEVLAERSSRGEAAALILPSVKGPGREALLRVMRTIDGIQPSPVAGGLFTLTVDGQPQTIDATQAGAIRKRAASILRDHLATVGIKASGAADAYNGQSEVDRKHWIAAPIVKSIGYLKTLGDFKDPGPQLLAFATRAQADIAAAQAALAAGNLTQAANLLASSESSALSAQKMWQAYFQGIIGAGEMTITVLEVTRDASFLTLAVLATIATGGAAAGALGAAEGTAATTTAFGVELGVSTATAANTIAVAAPIVANVSEAVAKVSMGDKVDWGALVIDTVIQVVVARFGGKITGGLAKAILGNPATERLAGKVTEKLVHTLILHVGSTALSAAAQDSYQALRGKNVTWQMFVDDLIARLTDPKSLAVLAITGALTSAAEARYGPKAPTPAPDRESTPPPVKQAPAPAPAKAVPAAATPDAGSATRVSATPPVSQEAPPSAVAAPAKPASTEAAPAPVAAKTEIIRRGTLPAAPSAEAAPPAPAPKPEITQLKPGVIRRRWPGGKPAPVPSAGEAPAGSMSEEAAQEMHELSTQENQVDSVEHADDVRGKPDLKLEKPAARLDKTTKLTKKDIARLGNPLSEPGDMGSATNPQILRRNWEKANGRPFPEGHDAHHIVPTKGGDFKGEGQNFGERARAILRRDGIGGDDAVNCAPLPSPLKKNNPDASSRTVYEASTSHGEIHNRVYFQDLAEALEASPEGGAADVLERFADMLKNKRYQ